MGELDQVLEHATAAVSELYFEVKIDGGHPIFRERVYCYELYHQLRSQWPDECAYTLNGELDKSGHPILTNLGASYAKPDLLIHTPGAMGGNHAIIEVKGPHPPLRDIRSDLKKLGLFRSSVGYDRAIYLIYGHQAERAVRRIASAAGAMRGLPGVELWIHDRVGAPARQVAMLRGSD